MRELEMIYDHKTANGYWITKRFATTDGAAWERAVNIIHQNPEEYRIISVKHVGNEAKKHPKIKFVRMYKMYREDWFDVIYHSGRIVSYTQPTLPTTVEKFVEEATNRTEQYDTLYKRYEMIYEP